MGKYDAVCRALAEMREEQGIAAVQRLVKETLDDVFDSLPDSEHANIKKAMENIVGRKMRKKGRLNGKGRKNGGIEGVGRMAALEIIAEAGRIWDRKGEEDEC